MSGDVVKVGVYKQKLTATDRIVFCRRLITPTATRTELRRPVGDGDQMFRTIKFVILAAAIVVTAQACGEGTSGTDEGSDSGLDTGFDAHYDARFDAVPDADQDIKPDTNLGDTVDTDATGDVDPSDTADTVADVCTLTDTECAYKESLTRITEENATVTMELDQWGGWANHPESLGDPAPTSFFRVEKLDGAWWFITPDGNPFLSKGVTDVTYWGAVWGDEEFHQIIVDKYGDESTWTGAAQARMLDWNFNTVGPWSSYEIGQRFAHATIILDSASHAQRYRPGDIVTDYWGDEFLQNCDKVATERATPYVADQRLLGYFLDNELLWGADWRGDLSLLQHYLDFPLDAPGRQEALRLVRESAADVTDFNAIWGTSITDWSELDGLSSADFVVTTAMADEVTTAFQILAFHQYATLAIDALREVDPGHLILGCRFAAYPGDPLIKAAAEHFDVISMAGYHSNWIDELDAIYPQVDKPFLIEEFSFKATDSGLNNILNYAVVVDTQKDRALAYRQFVEEFMRRPYGVAYHWYKWMDNPPLETNILAGDNFGLLNFNDDPYQDFVTYAGPMNRLIEKWHAEGDGRFNIDKVEFPYCDTDEDAINTIYDGMTVRQRIGQHLSMHIVASGSRVDPDSKTKMQAVLPGAVSIAQITGAAEGDPAKTARFLHDAQIIAQEYSGVPLFISGDQEGGVYTTINRATGGTDSIGPAAIGATRDETVAFRQFDMMAREVKAVGINMNFGPLVDTQYQINNGNLNTRTFGPDTELNTRLGVAAFAGFQKNLVLPMVKHFPGDGMTMGNTHFEFVTNAATMEELEAKLLKPFRAAFEAGCDAVMTIPARFSAIDDERAVIVSRKAITDFLRGELGFTGLVVSDDLGMYGARLGLTEDQSQAAEAIKAGTDLLLTGVDNVEPMIVAIEQELLSGGIPADEFEASTKRILRFKQKYCLFEKPTYPDEADIATIDQRIGRPDDAAMSYEHAVRAVTVLKDDGILPLTGKRILCVGPTQFVNDPATTWTWWIDESFCSVMARIDPSVLPNDYFIEMAKDSVQTLVQDNRENIDAVVVATFNGYFSPEQQDMLDWLLTSGDVPVVHVAQGVAFDTLQTMEGAHAVLALQGSLTVMFEAAVAVLYGTAEGGGQVLWDLDNLF